jgi:hypothetical protein
MRDKFLGLLIVLSWFISIVFVTASIQTPVEISGGKGWDGVGYAEMAEALAMGSKLPSFLKVEPNRTIIKVHQQRIGTPFLVSIVIRWFDMGVIDAFLVVNLCGVLVTVLLLYQFFLRFIEPGFAVLGTFLFMITWHAPLRFVFFYPVLTDYWFWVFWLAGLLIVSRPILSRIEALLLCLISFLGVMFFQVFILLPLSFFISSNAVIYRIKKLAEFLLGVNLNSEKEYELAKSKNRSFIVSLLALCCSVLGLLLLNLLMDTGTDNYSYLKTIIWWVFYQTKLIDLPLATFVAFGLPFSLLIINWKTAKAHLKNNRFHLTLLLLVAGLSIVGGADMARYLFWASPVVLLLIIICLKDIILRSQRNPRVYLLIAFLIFVHLIFSALVFPINAQLYLSFFCRTAMSLKDIIAIFTVHCVVLFSFVAMFKLAIRDILKEKNVSADT